MKKKEFQELYSKDLKDLKQLAKKIDEEIFKLRMDKKTAKLKNVHTLDDKRRDLAKIKAVIREKELGL